MIDESDIDDEVLEIKRAMKEAKIRKKWLLERQRGKSHESAIERDDQQEILRKLRSDCDEWKKKASELEFDLREARYEITQWTNKYSRLETEKEHQDTVYKNQIQDLQLKVEGVVRQDDDKFQLIYMECEKLAKVFDALAKNSEFSDSKTSLHILSKAKTFLHKIKEFSSTGEMTNLDYRQKVAFNVRNKESQQQLVTVDSTVDHAMLEMCRSLEEENSALHQTIDSLKEQLAEASRESAASQLIPHYRLAIVRSRTYAANLLEQIKREQETSKALREQLDETYRDLKQVVEEKRKLYKRVSKTALEDAELADIVGEEGDSLHRASHDRNKIYHHYHHRSSSKADSDQRRKEEKARHHSHHSSISRTSHSRRSCDDDSISADDRASRDMRKKKEEMLRMEIESLDSTIEKMKEKLSQAAMEQSQKILNEVLGNNIETL